MICCAVVAGPKMFQPFSHGLIETFRRREILKIPMANNLLGIDGFSMCIKAGPTAVIRNIKTLQFDNIFCALGIFVFVGCFQKKSQCVKWAFCSVDFKVCVECAALCGFLWNEMWNVQQCAAVCSSEAVCAALFAALCALTTCHPSTGPDRTSDSCGWAEKYVPFWYNTIPMVYVYVYTCEQIPYHTIRVTRYHTIHMTRYHTLRVTIPYHTICGRAEKYVSFWPSPVPLHQIYLAPFVFRSFVDLSENANVLQKSEWVAFIKQSKFKSILPRSEFGAVVMVGYSMYGRG